MKSTQSITLDWLHSHVVEQDGCLQWAGSGNEPGRVPQARIGGKLVSVRRVLWELVHERPAPAGMSVSSGCNNPKCVHPDHIKLRHRRLFLLGLKRPLVQKAKMAKTKNATSKWSQEVVQAIRASDEPARDVAERYGMCLSYVYYIRHDQARRGIQRTMGRPGWEGGMTAYYNEIDPAAAQWLRNLIVAGHIAPGYVLKSTQRNTLALGFDSLKNGGTSRNSARNAAFLIQPPVLAARMGGRKPCRLASAVPGLSTRPSAPSFDSECAGF